MGKRYFQTKRNDKTKRGKKSEKNKKNRMLNREDKGMKEFSKENRRKFKKNKDEGKVLQKNAIDNATEEKHYKSKDNLTRSKNKFKNKKEFKRSNENTESKIKLNENILNGEENNEVDENNFSKNKFDKYKKNDAIEEMYLRGKLICKDKLRELNALLKTSNINLEELVELLEELFERIYDNKNNEKITLREKVCLIEETLKIFEIKKSKKYILLRIKILELLIKVKEQLFVPLSHEITKIFEEIFNHVPSESGGVLTGYKLNDDKWNEEVSHILIKKILRITYKYFNKFSNNIGFIDLIPFITNKLSAFDHEDLKDLILVLNKHKEYLENDKENKSLMRIEELRNIEV